MSDSGLTVAALLTASRAAHAEYRQLANRTAAAEQKKPEGWQVSLWDALHFRRQAHEADPRHVDPSWAADGYGSTHDALMAFYEQQLGLQATDE